MCETFGAGSDFFAAPALFAPVVDPRALSPFERPRALAAPACACSGVERESLLRPGEVEFIRSPYGQYAQTGSCHAKRQGVFQSQ
jgi:hypothetical protein